MMRTRQNSLARLDQAAKAAQSALVAREAAKSEERLALIRTWHLQEAIAENHASLSEEELDYQILVMAEEFVYQHELKYGPVTALPIYEGDTVMSSEELAAIPRDEFTGMLKGILESGWKPDHKRRAVWLASQDQNAGERQ